MRPLVCIALIALAAANVSAVSKPMTNPPTSNSRAVQSGSDVSGLKSAADGLQRKVNRWNDWTILFIILAAIGAAGLVLTSVKLRRFNFDLSTVQGQLATAKDATALADSKQKDVEISKAQEGAAKATEDAAKATATAATANARAAGAQANLALAEQHAAEANAKAEGFQRDIAEANQRSAEANKMAEQEHLARLKLEASLADRTITPDQKSRLMQTFNGLKGQTVDVVIVGDTAEIAGFSATIVSCMTGAGVLVNVIHPMGAPATRGVVAGVRPDAPAAFTAAATEMIAILRESVADGAGLWDYDKLDLRNNASASGSSPGAAPMWTSAFRVFIGGK